MRFLILLLLIFSSKVLIAQSPAYKDVVFTEYFRRTSGWTASDATISVPLPSGKTIWLMGDSYIDNFNPADTTIPCLFQVRNSMLVQNILQPTEFITILDNTQTGVNRTPVKYAVNDNTYFWPGHGYVKGDTAIIFWQRYAGGDFTHLANFVTKIYTPGFTDASSIKQLAQLPIPAEFEFGTAVLVDSAKNFIYLYGFKKDWIIFRPLIARYPIGQDVLGPWEFFNGSGWSSDANASEQIMSSTNDYVSPSYSVLKLQGKYYMISQDIGFLTCGLGRDIYSWESDNPEGPFTNKKLLYTVEDKYKGEYMITYNATAHPEFIKDNELLISYNVNGACTKYCEDAFANRYNADLYRPKFIRVPLDYIDPVLNVPDPVFPIDPPPVTEVSGEYIFSGIALYPNPSKTGEFTIQLDRFTPLARIKVTVTNAYGQKFIEDDLPGFQKTFKLNATGLFFVNISSATQRWVTKIVIH
jgi:hypothetical protein